MGAWRLLSRCAAAALVLSGGLNARESRVFAALEEFDRFGSRELWPGFEPRGIPLEISEKGLTLELRGARVSRSGQTVTIILGTQRKATRADPSLRSG